MRRFAPPWARVVVVNDGSDARTTAFLRAQEGIVLLENETNLGFVKTANRGLLYSDAPWVCLLNSDTLLTEGALERMVARLREGPRDRPLLPARERRREPLREAPAGRGRLLLRAARRAHEPRALSRRDDDRRATAFS